MDIKEIREKLKDSGLEKLPRSNNDAIELYNKTFNADEQKEPEAAKKPLEVVKVDKNLYTYIGSGDTPPNMIKFMNKQVFTRGVAVEVKDQVALDKIKNNPCFVKGEVDQDTLYSNDEKAAKAAQHQRDEDVKIQIEMERKNRKG